ncbi:MAG: nicotinate-nicotinamide nucleotide adenylyltransferase [Deltaproteobacteria bacterium]|nr:nicotinate-nicotinamide nucleotide adenylyltransferase [Deltaproteobacteria bacterium]
MTRIALFGGSFNPPHVAHALVAHYVLATQPVDEVWIVPVYAHAFGKELAPYEDRVAMCRLAVAELGPRAPGDRASSRVKVSRAEEDLASKPGFTVSRTLDLVTHLQERSPTSEFRLVIGADILGETHKWYRWNEVVAKAPLIAIGRSGFDAPPGTTVTGVTMPEISATAIRELVAKGKSIDAPQLAALLPREVLRYIASHGLYRAPTP